MTLEEALLTHLLYPLHGCLCRLLLSLLPLPFLLDVSQLISHILLVPLTLLVHLLAGDIVGDVNFAVIAPLLALAYPILQVQAAGRKRVEQNKKTNMDNAQIQCRFWYIVNGCAAERPASWSQA